MKTFSQFLVIFLLFSFVVNSCASRKSIVVINDEKVIGINLIDNKAIEVVEHLLPERIYNHNYDTISGFLTIQLRGVSRRGRNLKRGNIIQYDPKNKEVKWVKKIDYRSTELQQFNDLIIEKSGYKSRRLDVNTGENLWEFFNDLRLVDPTHSIGIGYRYKELEGYTNTLQGINMNSGRLIWVRELNREYEWNNIHHLNDSIILLVANGLSTINIKNGAGWNYELITGNKDYTRTAVINAAGVTLGLLTGLFVFAGGYDLASGLVSNVLIDSTDLYIASKEKISRVNKLNGKEIWSTGLPKGIPSNSTILMNDSLIFMVNKGYAYSRNRMITYGKPFIAAFSKNDGEEKYNSVISHGESGIQMVSLREDTLYLFFEERISKYSIEDGNRINEKTFNVNESGAFWFFITDKAFILANDSTFKNLELHDSSKFYVYSSKDKILAIDDDLNLTKTYEPEDLYIYYLEKNDLKFLFNDGKTIIIDADNKKIAELPISNNAIIIGDKLYGFQENSLFEINLNDITGYNKPMSVLH